MTMTAVKPVNKTTERNSEEFAPELDLGNFVESFRNHTQFKYEYRLGKQSNFLLIPKRFFSTGFISHQFLDVTANFAVVRSVLFSPGWSLRLNHLHQYLCSNLRMYATECTAVYPPTELMQVSGTIFRSICSVIEKVMLFSSN